MSWVSPTSYNDPDSQWINEIRVYDENEFSFSTNGYEGYYLELFHSAINCDKVRIIVSAYLTPNIDVDVHYGGAWHNIHTGEIASGDWVELPIGSTQSVDQARIKFNDGYMDRYVYEFDFWEVEVPPARRIFITHQYRRLKNLWVPRLRKFWLPRPPVCVPKGVVVQ